MDRKDRSDRAISASIDESKANAPSAANDSAPSVRTQTGTRPYPRLRRFADWCTNNRRWNPLPYFFFFGGPILLAIPLLRWTLGELLCWAGLHYAMSIGVNLSHHRYFSHHSFATSRALQFLIGLWGCLSLQRGPLWWSAAHRLHHQRCETDDDPHSPNKGFYESHFGWTMDPRYSQVLWNRIPDWMVYPEIYLLEGAQIVLLPLLTTAAFLVGGWHLVAIYFLALTTALNAEAAVNSLCHRRSEAGCAAIDVLWIALLNGGDGFHGHHHRSPRSARHGVLRGQPDLTYGVICGLERVGLVWNVAHEKIAKK